MLGTPWRNLTFVQVHTDDGLVGVGEARMLNHTDALLGYLAEAVPQPRPRQRPVRHRALVQRMKFGDYGRAGEIAMSGIALRRDGLLGHHRQGARPAGVPAARRRPRDRIKAYANGWYTVERTPEEFHAAARRVVERGYRALKFDPFGAGLYELERDERMRSIALVEAVRDAVGPDVEILIEMHGRFAAPRGDPHRRGCSSRSSRPGSRSRCRRRTSRRCARSPSTRRCRSPPASASTTGIEFRELFELQAADIIQPDIAHIGGILETKKLAATAETYYVLVAPHNVGGPVLTAAALHLAACTPNFKIQEHFNDFADAGGQAGRARAARVVDGYFALPDRPGLGVELDVDFVAEHPRHRRPLRPVRRTDWHLRGDRGAGAVTPSGSTRPASSGSSTRRAGARGRGGAGARRLRGHLRLRRRASARAAARRP